MIIQFVVRGNYNPTLEGKVYGRFQNKGALIAV